MMCGPWQPEHATRPDAAMGLCYQCGAEVVYMASNKPRMEKEGIELICQLCTEKLATEMAERGEPIVYKGLLIRGKSDLERAQEN